MAEGTPSTDLDASGREVASILWHKAKDFLPLAYSKRR